RVSFHPESALFHPGCANLRVFLCGVPMYASAQTLVFLAPFGAALGNPEMTGRQTVRAMSKNAFFPNWKLLVSHPGFPDGYELFDPGRQRPLYIPPLGSRVFVQADDPPVLELENKPFSQPGNKKTGKPLHERQMPYEHQIIARFQRICNCGDIIERINA